MLRNKDKVVTINQGCFLDFSCGINCRPILQVRVKDGKIYVSKEVLCLNNS